MQFTKGSGGGSIAPIVYVVHRRRRSLHEFWWMPKKNNNPGHPNVWDHFIKNKLVMKRVSCKLCEVKLTSVAALRQRTDT